LTVLGHKADIGFMALGPDMVRLRTFQTALGAAGLELTSSYLSLTEVSEYAKGCPSNGCGTGSTRSCARRQAGVLLLPHVQASGRDRQWYAAPYDVREQLMLAHGATGRTFAGRVLQVITGSAGLDDYEWGVSLFAVRPDDLKDVVYTMRFDEASAATPSSGPSTRAWSVPSPTCWPPPEWPNG